jgi:LacI family transcriptional regulator
MQKKPPLQPRVLLAMRSFSHSERQMLRGFHAIAGERNWLVMMVEPIKSVPVAVRTWHPDVCVVGPAPARAMPSSFWTGRLVVGMNVHPTLRQFKVPSLRPDDPAIGKLAAEHLLAKGYRNFAAMMLDRFPWAIDRIEAFENTARKLGGQVHRRGEFSFEQAMASGNFEQAMAGGDVGKWARSLPMGTAVLTACDEWGALLSLSCRIAKIAVPEQLAIMGVDDDDLCCETCQPHLSSVRIPWEEIGRQTARLVETGLREGSIPTQSMSLPPAGVIERRSTEVLIAGHPTITQALRYIRSRAHESLEVREVVGNVVTNRRWLERAFRKHLGHTIHQEILRAQMDRARHLLATTRLRMSDVARGSGFGQATARFSRTFHQIEGVTPSAYRRNYAFRA